MVLSSALIMIAGVLSGAVIAKKDEPLLALILVVCCAVFAILISPGDPPDP